MSGHISCVEQASSRTQSAQYSVMASLVMEQSRPASVQLVVHSQQICFQTRKLCLQALAGNRDQIHLSWSEICCQSIKQTSAASNIEYLISQPSKSGCFSICTPAQYAQRWLRVRHSCSPTWCRCCASTWWPGFATCKPASCCYPALPDCLATWLIKQSLPHTEIQLLSGPQRIVLGAAWYESTCTCGMENSMKKLRIACCCFSEYVGTVQRQEGLRSEPTAN